MLENFWQNELWDRLKWYVQAIKSMPNERKWWIEWLDGHYSKHAIIDFQRFKPAPGSNDCIRTSHDFE